MNAASMALFLLAGSVGAATDAPVPLNDRAIKIPFRLAVAPAEVNEVVLFVSIDQGKNWSRASSIRPMETYLPFQAPTDGQYWFNIAVMYRNGSQVPIDVSLSPPQQKVIIDTQKPAVQIAAAEKVGDEVAVSWEIQEANPDLASLKLEYRSADSSTGSFWTAVPASPGLAGQARFRPAISGPITVKLSINDAVNNTGAAERTINIPVVAPPAAMKIEEPAPVPAAVQPVTVPVAVPIAPVVPAPAAVTPVSAAQQVPLNDVSPPVIPVATSNRQMPIHSSDADLRPEMRDMYYTNEPQVTVDYEVVHGPSGISKIEVYLTQDDGRTWLKWQELTPNDLHKGEPMKSNSIPVTVRLPDREGVFGYRLIPYSGSQLSNGAPQSGTDPEFRIQYDRTAPYIELFRPEADPAPSHRSALVLQWKATDTNLAETSIRIYWSEQPNGPWQAVNAGQELLGGEVPGMMNTGKYNWNVPSTVPLRVYLRITAEDKAGNVAEAVTPQSVVVDLHKPVGRFKGIVGAKK